MKYIHRNIEDKFIKMSKTFKAVLLTGPRQSGKSTMLKHLAEDTDRKIVSLDDVNIRTFALEDPVLFFQQYKPPIIIDEVQKAPALFDQIKIICDSTDEKGLFWLTGSQSLKLTKSTSDSLAGRVCVLNLLPLSYSELRGIDNSKFEFSIDNILERKQKSIIDINDIFERIWEGMMPETIDYDAGQLKEYWNSYIEMYLMRDAVDDNGVKDTSSFRRFLKACAAFSSHMINYNDIAQASGVSGVTVKSWIKVLENMGIIYMLEPYFDNDLKKLVKTPKLYFIDTGLCSFLSSWNSKESLQDGASNGAYFENFVVSEILKKFTYGTSKGNLYYYRDTNQKEIDIVINANNKLFPFEVKLTSMPDKSMINSFRLLASSKNAIGNGGILCTINKPQLLDENNIAMPITMI